MPAAAAPDGPDPTPAIPANHWPLAQEVLYRGVVLPATWSTFSAVRFASDGPLPHPSDGPLIIYLTHTSWWDAYMLFLIYYRALEGGFQNYILMEEKQLRSFRFFTWCGAFSIDRRRPGDADRSIGYIGQRLRERQDRCLWIFPQGRIVPADRRPLVVFPGIARIVREAGGATLCPVAMRYEFRGEQRPEVFIRMGAWHYAAPPGDEGRLIADVGRQLTAAADVIREDLIAERTEGYRILMRGRQGIDRTTEAWLRRLRPPARG